MPDVRSMSAAAGNGQKACPRGGGESVQQGRSHFGARSVLSVREHGKRARTPLAAFFNIPLRTFSSLRMGCEDREGKRNRNSIHLPSGEQLWPSCGDGSVSEFEVFPV